MRRAGAGLCAALALACAGTGPAGYRLADSGAHWDRAEGGAILAGVKPRYPDYFAVILDPGRTQEPDLRPIRRDIEHTPVDARNYAALHAVAIGYFELNYRAESTPGGRTYLSDSFRAAKLLAVPWRAYGLVRDDALRDAILAFFEDAGSGEKLATESTAARLARIVASLAPKEPDPERRARIEALAASLTDTPPLYHAP
jgi:hypothetical protein